MYKKIVLLTALFVLLLPACSSMRTIDVAQVNTHEQLIKQIDVGDVVSVITKDGKTHEFTVKLINSEVISGNEIEISISEVNEIKKKEFSILKTGGLIPITWVGLTLIVLAII